MYLHFMANYLTLLMLVGTAPIQKLENIFVKARRLPYQGYFVSRAFNADTETTTVTISRGRKTLLRLRQENNSYDSSRFGLFSFLGGKTKQLIVEQWGGGAHCCYTWRIYQLTPAFHLIFDSDKYPIGDGMDDYARLLDLDRDGVFEFIQNSNQFAYFQGYCFVCLPRPEVIFKYDRATNQYLPADQRFRSYALREISFYKKTIKECIQKGDRNIFYYVLDIVISYIYAGMQKRAWRFYDAQMKGREWEAMKRDIQQELRRDNIYRFLYSVGSALK